MEETADKVLEILSRDAKVCSIIRSMETDPYRRKVCKDTADIIRRFVKLQYGKDARLKRTDLNHESSLYDCVEILRSDAKTLIGLTTTVGGPLTSEPLFPRRGWPAVKEAYAHLCGLYSHIRDPIKPGYWR